MPDTFTEVTNESWFSRIGSAIKGILVGALLFVVAFPVLFINEGRAVKTYKTLKEGAGAVVSVVADAVDSGNEGKLVHMSGQAVTDETLSDPVFGISAKGIKLKRQVEMYQWKQTESTKTKKKVGGGTQKSTTYSYKKEWSGGAIDSAGFKESAGHQNPGAMPYSSTDLQASLVKVGAFTLSASLVGKISNYTPLPVAANTKLPAALQGRGKVANAGFYIGGNPSSPQVGDVRVSFKIVKPGDVSLISKQIGNGLAPFTASTGKNIELLQTGIHAADAMFAKAQADNKMLTWLLRAVGLILMMVGINMILRPLSVVADVLPILGNIVGAGIGIIAFLVAAACSLITVSIAWVFYRPLLGVPLLVVGVVGIIMAIGKVKAAKQG